MARPAGPMDLGRAAETGMEKKLFYLLVKLGRFLIQESGGEFNQNTIAALKDQGWTVHGPYLSRRRAKDEAYQQERRGTILD